MTRRFTDWIRARQTALRRQGRKGAAAVEMALIAPVFFLLMIGITELCLLMAAQQLMENAAYNTSRLAKTGYSASGQTQSQSVNQIMVSELQSFGTLIDTTKVTVTEAAYNSFSAAASGNGGASGLGGSTQIVVYTISYPWKLFTPMMSALIGSGGTYTITSHIVVRNEPY